LEDRIKGIVIYALNRWFKPHEPHLTMHLPVLFLLFIFPAHRMFTDFRFQRRHATTIGGDALFQSGVIPKNKYIKKYAIGCIMAP